MECPNCWQETNLVWRRSDGTSDCPQCNDQVRIKNLENYRDSARDTLKNLADRTKELKEERDGWLEGYNERGQLLKACEAHNRRLQSENARLREERDKAIEMIDGALIEENTRLREDKERLIDALEDIVNADPEYWGVALEQARDTIDKAREGEK